MPEQEIGNVEDLKGEVLPVVRQADETAVQSAESYQAAGAFLKDIKTAQKRVVAFFDPLKKSTRAAWQAVLAREKEMLGPLAAAESGVKRKMGAWHEAQERIRREQERKLQSAAEAKARKERERLAARAAAAAAKGQTEKAESLEDKAAEVVAPVIACSRKRRRWKGSSTARHGRRGSRRQKTYRVSG